MKVTERPDFLERLLELLTLLSAVGALLYDKISRHKLARARVIEAEVAKERERADRLDARRRRRAAEQDRKKRPPGFQVDR